MHAELDLDVIELICNSMNHVATILSFSLVSRDLRVIALKRLLTMKPILLKNERTTRAFHEFVFANPETRMPCVRALTIDIHMADENTRSETVRCLVEILDNAPHLSTLTMPSPRWTFDCLSDPRLSEAIARLPTLRELGLMVDCKESEEIVRSTRSVSTLRILRVPIPNANYGFKVTELDTFLRHLSDTLEVLDITGIGSLTLDVKGARYPALRSLYARIADGIIRTDILIAKFPALDDTLGLGFWLSELEDNVPKQQRIRLSNQERQKLRSWKDLDCVEGNALSVFVLGLTCPVRSIMVGLCSHHKDQMVEILRSTPPIHLGLSVALSHGDSVFQDLFPPEVVPRLTHLRVVLSYDNPWTGIDDVDQDGVKNLQWRELLAKVIDSIRVLRLTHLRLAVYYEIDLYEDCLPYSKSFVRSLVDLDHGQLAAELMHAVPTLQCVFVDTGGQFAEDVPRSPTRGRWIAQTAWSRVTQSAPQPSGKPRQLDEDAMERTELTEDLTLSNMDQSSLGLNSTWSEEQTAPWTPPE